MQKKIDTAPPEQRIADRICLSVAEITDRFSPEFQPEMMLVTPDELRTIVIAALEDYRDSSIAALAKVNAEAWIHVRQLIGGWRNTTSDNEWSEYDQMCERLAQEAHETCELYVSLPNPPGVQLASSAEAAEKLAEALKMIADGDVIPYANIANAALAQYAALKDAK